MRQFKAIVPFVLFLVLVLLLLPTTAEAATVGSGACGENVTWTLDDQGTLTISGTGPMKYATPWQQYATSVQKVVIEEGVTTICEAAFFDFSNLAEISIPNTVTILDNGALWGCTSLQEVTLPAELKTVSNYLFHHCTSLTEVTIPEGVTSIGTNAFYNCKNMVSVAIPSSMTTIGDAAFRYCDSLETVWYTGSQAQTEAISIAANNDPLTAAIWQYDASPAFSGTCGDDLTWSLDHSGTLTISGTGPMERHYSPMDYPWYDSRSFIKKVVVQSGVTVISQHAFSYLTNLSKVLLPNTVTTIEDSAFSSCKALTQITLPEGLTTINQLAFAHSGLTGITIPASVDLIAWIPFDGCEQLEYIHVAEGSQHYAHDSRGVLFNKDKTFLAQAPGKLSGHYTIPETVTHVQPLAFYSCKQLKSLSVGTAMIDLGNFGQELEDLYYCGTPAQWDALQKDFYEDPKQIHYNCIVGTCGDTLGWALDSTGTLSILGSGPMNDYTYSSSPLLNAPPPWANYKGSIKKIILDDSVTTIGSQAFQNCVFLNTVQLGTELTKIGSSAFAECLSLDSLDLPTSVSQIGTNAFSGCTQFQTVRYAGSRKDRNDIDISDGNSCLTDATWNYGIASIFSGSCGENLTWTLDEDGLLTISGTGAMESYTTAGEAPWYEYCSEIKTVVIGDEVTSIGGFSFYRCQELTEVTIGSRVTTIEKRAFSHCKKLSAITFGSQVTTISRYAFNQCESLKTVTLPDGLTTIEMWVFNQCSSLEEITLPATLTTVGNYAFADCKALRDVYYGGFLVQWEDISIGYSNEPLLEATLHYLRQPGDMNDDGQKDTDDAVYLLLHILFGAETYPIDSTVDLDINGDGKADTDDAVYLLLNVLFGEETYPLAV